MLLKRRRLKRRGLGPDCRGLLWRWLVVLAPIAGLGVLACQSASVSSPPSQSPPPESGQAFVSTGEPSADALAAPPATAWNTEQPSPRPRLRLVPLGDQRLEPLSVIEAPTDGQRLVVSADDLAIELKPGVVAPGQQLLLKLDHFAPRRVLPRQRRFSLRDLMFEWDRLRPGRHRLVAYVEAEAGSAALAGARQFQSISFSVVAPRGAAEPAGSKYVSSGETMPVSSEYVLLQPHGTINGPEAAKRATLEVVAINEAALGSTTLRLTAAEPGGALFEQTVKPGRYSLQNLVSGDYEFRLSSQPEQVAERVSVTVNLDINPVPPQPSRP